MIKLEDIHTVFFLGIGGIGMSALARYFKYMGMEVHGYDQTQTPLTCALVDQGMSIHYNPNAPAISAILPAVDLVVYTPAIPSSDPLWKDILDRGIATLKRAEVLGLITDSATCIAVGGTHGKTTTTAILTHIFKVYFKQVNAFVGGILSQYDTNSFYAKQSPYFVVEADEFDGSFLHLNPNFAVLNSIEADHLDQYSDETQVIESFQAFVDKIQGDGTLIVHQNIVGIDVLAPRSCYTFGIGKTADFGAKSIRIEDGIYGFTYIHAEGKGQTIELQMPGMHNIENALGACAVATLCGIPDCEIAGAIKSFRGVKRRFEINTDQSGRVYIDDYAHHPTAINMVLVSAREMYPGKKLTVIFQPHLYSRTRDFEEEFAHELAGFDEVVLLDIYPARELPIAGVSSTALLSKIGNTNKKIIDKKGVLDYLMLHNFEVLLTLGAGDIDTLVLPIKKMMKG